MNEAILMMGGLGIIIGAGLAAASKIFYVYVDPKITAIEDVLPGANCGGCGLPGCTANAEAIVAGTAEPNSCVAASEDEITQIAQIMGVSIEAAEPDIALPGCYFGTQDADTRYIYSGINDCRAAALLGGGMKVCTIGCLGLGTCAKNCPFDAITMGPDGLPVVDEERCTGCGTCERICPKHIITLSSRTRRILREYTTDECTTPCQRGCPAGINIREYILQISKGNYRQALQVIKERNPFPTVIGRICPRPCETECRRNLVDEPVAINFLKRYVADIEKDTGDRVQPYKAPDTGRRVAVVGGGVEGLSTAYFCARLGHAASVYEATDSLGGLLRMAIARERLPLDILDWDIGGIVDMGVSIETGQALGRDMTVSSLLEQGYEAVFLALGGWDGRLARGDGGSGVLPIPGTHLFLDVLRDSETVLGSSWGPDAVIAGGGRLALKAAMRCGDMGAKTVTILLRETEEDSSITDADAAALDSVTVNLVFNSAVCQLIGEENRLSEIEYRNLVTCETVRIQAQNLIIAAGRFPELIFRRQPIEDGSEGVETDVASDNGPVCWEAFQPYKHPFLRDQHGFFAEGDALTDYSAAIEAIGAGRRSAASIHQTLYGQMPSLSDDAIAPGFYVQDVDDVEGVPVVHRHAMPINDARVLEAGGEIEKGFDEKTARAEADRCLQCGLICYNRSNETVQIGEAVAAG